MNIPWKPRRWSLLFLFFLAGDAGAADEYSFDASAFEKKPFELGGYLQFRQDDIRLNRGGAFYKLNFYNQPQRQDLDSTAGTTELVGKLRYGIGTFDFRSHSDIQRDQISHDHNNKMLEAAYSIRPTPGITLEAGKRTLRWGKGYAWNPIGFVERPKDPNDPDLAREGYWMSDADLIFNRDGAFKTLAFTPVLLPVGNEVNSDFGSTGHLNPAAKLYMLYRDTDIDFAWQGKGSRAARFGMDFSRNIASNFEIHGEWARIKNFTKPVTNSNGIVTSQVGNATSWLLGLRYLTAGETTFITEYYRNGTGYSSQEFEQFTQFANTSLTQFQQNGTAALIQKALSLSQTSYGRPNPGKDYVYFRAQQKDAFGILYFQPAVTAIMNWNDRSYQITPEMQYSGVTNLELRLKVFLLQGGNATDFGERQVSNRLEFRARYYF